MPGLRQEVGPGEGRPVESRIAELSRLRLALQSAAEIHLPAPDVIWQRRREFRFGSGIGALVLTSAGAAWAFIALANWPPATGWEFAAVALPTLVLIAAGVLGLIKVAREPALPSGSPEDDLASARGGRRVRRLFFVVFAIEGLAIAGVVIAAQAMGRPLLIPIGVLTVVGLHFLPLGSLFRMPIYSVCGGLLVGVAAFSFLIPDENVRVFALAMGAAAVLFASAARVLSAYTFAGPLS